jgi:hypothetical protein
VGGRLAEGGEALRERVAALRLAHGVGPVLDEQQEQLGRAVEEVEPLLGGGGVAGGVVFAGRRDRPRDLAGVARDLLLEGAEEEVLLAAEVRVDRAARVAGGGGDLVDRRAAEAALAEQAGGGLEEVLAGFLLTASQITDVTGVAGVMRARCACFSCAGFAVALRSGGRASGAAVPACQ